MNRLEQWLKSSTIVLETESESPELSPALAKRRSPAEAIQFFLPEHYERGYAYPLVVWLHGAGEDERQLNVIMPELSLRNYVGVSTRGTELPEFGPGYAWSGATDGVEQCQQSVFAAIDYAIARANISPQRIFLAGKGEGGTLAIRLALTNPHCFAGALSFGGGFPRGNQVLSRLKEARTVPLFVAVGAESLEYPTQQLCDDLRLCHLAWLSMFVKQYHPCGDELVRDMMQDANDWIMKHVTGASESVA